MNDQGEAVREGPIWVCRAKRCPHRIASGGCELGKVSIVCDDTTCRYNIEIGRGAHGCRAMGVMLDAEGKCLLRG